MKMENKYIDKTDLANEVHMNVLYDSDRKPFIVITISGNINDSNHHITTESFVKFVGRNFGAKLEVLKEAKDCVK